MLEVMLLLSKLRKKDNYRAGREVDQLLIRCLGALSLDILDGLCDASTLDAIDSFKLHGNILRLALVVLAKVVGQGNQPISLDVKIRSAEKLLDLRRFKASSKIICYQSIFDKFLALFSLRNALDDVDFFAQFYFRRLLTYQTQKITDFLSFTASFEQSFFRDLLIFYEVIVQKN